MMQEFIKSLIVLVIGGSLIGLLVPNEKIGKGVRFTISLFVTIGIITSFTSISQSIEYDKPPSLSIEDIESPYVEGVKLSVQSEVENYFKIYTGEFADEVTVNCRSTENKVNIENVIIKTRLRKDGLLEYIKKSCGLDCVEYEE